MSPNHTTIEYIMSFITRVPDEGGGISHEEVEGQRARNKDERIRGTMDASEDGR